jgi:IS5 family transposase
MVERDSGFIKTRYRGLAKNRSLLRVLLAAENWLVRVRAVALTG